MAKPDWLAKLDAAAENADDPALEGVVKIAGFVEKTQRETDARLTNFEEKIAESASKTEKQLSTVDNKIEALGKTVMDELDSFKTRGLAVGLLSYNNDPKNNLLQAIPEADRKSISMQEVFGTHPSDKGTPMEDPVFRAAADLWFRKSTQIQHGRWKGEHARLHNEVSTLEKAFEDIYQKTAMTGGTDGTGGYGVPNIVAAEVLRLVKDSGLAFNVCRQIPMSSDTLVIPNEANAFTTYWASEAGTLTDGGHATPFAANTLSAKKVIGRATASSEAVDDIVFNLLGYVREIMAEGIARAIDVEVFEGTTNFSGIISATGVNSVTTTTTNGDTLVLADLTGTLFAATHQASRDNGAWFCGPVVWSKIVGFADTTGQGIFMHGASNPLPGAIPMTLLGYPVYVSSAMSSTITRGTATTGNLYFGPRNKLILGVRKAMSWDVTDAVNWHKDQIDMRLITRVAFTVGTPAAFTALSGIYTT